MQYDCIVFASSHLAFSVFLSVQSHFSFCSDFLLFTDTLVTRVLDLTVASVCQSHTRKTALQEEIHSKVRPPTPCSVRSWRISRSQGTVLSPCSHQGRFLKSKQRKQQEAQAAAKPLCPSVRMFLRRVHKEVFPKGRPVGPVSISTLWQRAFANWFSQRWVLTLWRFYCSFENC